LATSDRVRALSSAVVDSSVLAGDQGGKGSSLVLMATDRYRLAMRELTWSPSNTELSTTALLKARTLSDVAKSLTSSGDVTVALSSESAAPPPPLPPSRRG